MTFEPRLNEPIAFMAPYNIFIDLVTCPGQTHSLINDSIDIFELMVAY